MFTYTNEDIIRFYNKITIREDGCWDVNCHKNDRGYPDFSIKRKPQRANRFMYMIWHQDENIDGLFVCHSCDYRGCVNPEHLFIDTHQGNMDDMVAKGRSARGSLNRAAKLSEDDVIDIITNTLSGHFTSYNEIIKHYSIGMTAIHNIIKSKKWVHITKDYDMVKIRNLLDTYHGCNNPASKFTRNDIIDIKTRLKNKEQIKDIANIYNVNRKTIYSINVGKIYTDIILE